MIAKSKIMRMIFRIKRTMAHPPMGGYAANWQILQPFHVRRCGFGHQFFRANIIKGNL